MDESLPAEADGVYDAFVISLFAIMPGVTLCGCAEVMVFFTPDKLFLSFGRFGDGWFFCRAFTVF